VTKFLDREGLAELGINFSRDHLRRLVKQNRFPKPFKVSPGDSGKLFWRTEDIEAFVAARQAAANAA
jgi:predicted DNA-binding transcriptional regulator AlpA